MKKLFTSLLCTAGAVAFAQWSPAVFHGDGSRSTGNVKNFYKLDIGQIRAKLASAGEMGKGARAVEVQIPTMDGRVERFEVYSFPVMAKSLADRYELGSYVGVGIDDPAKYVRFSVAPNDFQSMIIKNGKFEFVEPMDKYKTVYGVHPKTYDSDSKVGFVCTTEEPEMSKKEFQKLLESGNRFPYSSNTTAKMSDQKYRTMRLALSVTGEYTQYFGGVAQALAQINATVTRVNGVYEKELALHLNLQDFPQLIYTDPATDPYSDAKNISNWNLELQKTLTAVVGEANYDIGHLFGASGGGGNAGCIGCVCVSPAVDSGGVATNNGKGSGITSPADKKPFGDNFDIDYVAHEMGHQLGANHTFSHKLENAGVNIEPGSGTTIMGYAGITGASTDVQPHSDPYFSTASITQIQANMISKTCDVETGIANTPPTIQPMPDLYIPKGTAFYLTAKASDAENDPLTYSWEEIDNAAVVINKNNLGTTTTGASFRVMNPSTSPTRFFPQFESVMGGVLNNSLNTWEAVSTVARTTNFQVLVRDNNPQNTMQQTQRATQKVVVGDKGPFKVISNKVFTDVPTTDIKWDVAATTAAPYNISNVKIDYTVDNGVNWVTLAESTANDGSEAFDFRSIPTGNTIKLRVSPIGGVFYAVGALVAAKFPTTVPDCPTIKAPANGATNISYTTATTLSWTAPATGEMPDAYDVYFDQNQNPSTLVATNTTDTSVSVSATAPATTYYWKVVPKNALGAATGCQVYSFKTSDPVYCTAGATTTLYEKIANVSFADINNSSTSTAGYEDFTAVTGKVGPGEYKLTVTGSTSFSSDRLVVWIDFNNDKDFNDDGEQVLIVSRTGTNNEFTGTVKIPKLDNDVKTRMRIRLVDSSIGSNLTPCGTSSYGQVEDYTLSISSTMSTGEAGTKKGLVIYPNPATDVLNISSVSAKAQYTIYSISGSLAAKGLVANGKVNVSGLSKGVYLITIQDGEDRTTQKFIKN